MKLLIFIVTYNAEKTVRSVVSRIPAALFEDPRLQTEILIIDDGSKDSTFSLSYDLKENFSKCPLTVLKNPKNLGYGGNQKLGYRYALDHGFDVVALLHGDGQYAPEELPRLLEPFHAGEAEAVFGSRMMSGTTALKGGMPLYKFFGNKGLTYLENSLVGTKLSEYHSGFRLYNTGALRKIPFERNSDYFDFDTEIIIQLHAAGLRIKELPIPTFYGDEICHVNGVLYALKILLSCLQYRCQRLSLFYDPKFDVSEENDYYQSKYDFLSSHSLALARVEPTDRVLLLGSGPLDLVRPFIERAKSVVVIDQYVQGSLAAVVEESYSTDIEQFDLNTLNGKFDKVFALDIIEHLRCPELLLERLKSSPATAGATLVLTTPNIAFLPVRVMLALGSFNYGKRGILDRTHTRLFTRSALRRTFKQSGYEVLSMRGIPAPFPLAVGRGQLGSALLACNDILAKLLPGFFSYQLYIEGMAKPSVDSLLSKAVAHSDTLVKELEREAERNAA